MLAARLLLTGEHLFHGFLRRVGFRSYQDHGVGRREWDVALPHPQTSRHWVRGAAVVPHKVPPKQNFMGQLLYTQDGMLNGH
ncbi:hypothetical protein T08_1282 [Trichinella sp. T8]|nr:hypothetical protein T08_1282 [Trichinella sp. T8]